MEFTSRNSYKPTESEINDFESVNKIQLPDDYRNFLLTVNGGELKSNKISNSSKVVSSIFGMHNGDFNTSLYQHIDVYKDRIPFNSFPIATDPFGNLYIMAVHPDNLGQVYFWDHEKEPKIQDGHYMGNITFVANSFSDFIKKIQ